MQLIADAARAHRRRRRSCWQGRDLVPLATDEMRKIRGKEIAMIFQEPMTSLNPVYTRRRADRRGACACTRA